MAIHTRSDYFALATGIRTDRLYGASRLLSQVTGITVPINKPVVGENAFAHEAGIHQDGVLKNVATYEIMRPETVGRASNNLVLGKHSGRHAFVKRLESLGLFYEELDVNKAFAAFKSLADRKKDVFDDDLVAIVAEESTRVPKHYRLLRLAVTSSSEEPPFAQLTLAVGDQEFSAEGSGDGAVDACYNAIADVLRAQNRDLPALDRYVVKGITGGTDAQGEVSCLLRDGETVALGQSSHTDIVQASAHAYISALNKLDYLRDYRPVSGTPGP